VSWADGRADLQRECIEGAWSLTQLDLELHRRVGLRTYGGRPRRVAEDVRGAIVQLCQMAGTWERWCAAAGKAERRTKSLLAKLPGPISEGVTKVSGEMSRLRTKLRNELDSLQLSERRRPRR
jgi:hypothetical protein